MVKKYKNLEEIEKVYGNLKRGQVFTLRQDKTAAEMLRYTINRQANRQKRAIGYSAVDLEDLKKGLYMITHKCVYSHAITQNCSFTEFKNTYYVYLKNLKTNSKSIYVSPHFILSHFKPSKGISKETVRLLYGKI